MSFNGWIEDVNKRETHTEKRNERRGEERRGEKQKSMAIKKSREEEKTTEGTVGYERRNSWIRIVSMSGNVCLLFVVIA
jgi:hypothetical protein